MECPQYMGKIRRNSKNEKVLNLVISGMPSIPFERDNIVGTCISFKPCYKWNALNTCWSNMCKRWREFQSVLNLVISGMPSILLYELCWAIWLWVLNLVISGMPSIPGIGGSFANWLLEVLNFVISGMPSILLESFLLF